MRALVPEYDMITAGSLDDALDLLAREPGVWKPLAGGTDLMVLFEAGKLEHKTYINIWGLRELRGIDIRDDAVLLGALTTYSDVLRHPVLNAEFPMLCRAASETGGVATQNRGTLGGNIVNASPAADSPPALLVYDAELELVSSGGSRWVPYHGFHTGYKQMLLRHDELLRRIRLPRGRKHWRQYYRKVGTRKAQAISKVCLAAAGDFGDSGLVRDIRIAVASVAPTVLRCVNTESTLRGRVVDINAATEALLREIAPIDDIRSTAAYRARVAANLLEEFLAV